jgi:CP family cyanate transporter-like MFS transporter
MPIAVRERVADRPAFATGVYTAGINVGSTLAAAVAVPLAATGSWRTALVVLSAASVALGALWLWQTRAEPPVLRVRPQRPRLPWRDGTAWVLVAVFALLGVGFYGLTQWLPESYVERGWSESHAGVLLAVFQLTMIPGGLLTAALAQRTGSRRRYMVAGGSCQIVSILGIVLLPGGAFAWATLYGLVNGGLFTLVMTLPLDVAQRDEDVGAVAGFMLGAGYTLAALAPFALGAIRDATGTFTGSLWVVVAAAVVMTALCARLSRERLGRGLRLGPPAPAVR